MLNIINAGPVCRNEKRSSRLGIQVSLLYTFFCFYGQFCGRVMRDDIIIISLTLHMPLFLIRARAQRKGEGIRIGHALLECWQIAEL